MTLGHLTAPILWHETLPTTMREAEAEANRGAQNLTVVATRAQTQGRGRYGKPWQSGRDRGLWCTALVHLPPTRPPAELSLISALAVLDVLVARYTWVQEPPTLKWPNDILVGEAKLAGILLERCLVFGTQDAALVGLGLNLVPPEAGVELPAAALVPCGLKDQVRENIGAEGLHLEARTLAKSFQEKLAQRISSWHDAGLAGLVEALNKQHSLNGAAVSLERGDGSRLDGEALRIDGRGALVVLTPAGELPVMSGEVRRVRPHPKGPQVSLAGRVEADALSSKS